MVTIQQRSADGGYYVEIADFHAYVAALQARGIEPPRAQYRFFVSLDDEQYLRASPDDWRRQFELFYRIGDSTGIPCQFAADRAGNNTKGSHGQETNDDR